jgi:YD repeat-containing protein
MPVSAYFENAKKVRMYYDPRGRVVETINPDDHSAARSFWCSKLYFNHTG